MKKMKVASVFLALLSVSFFVFAITAKDCWNEFATRIIWCDNSFEDGSDAEATCLSGALAGYTDCLRRVKDPFDINKPLISKLAGAKLFRNTGKPQKEALVFNVDSEGYYYINIANGIKEDSKTQVSSAVLTLDGKKVLSPDDLNKNVFFKVVKVYLTPGEHILSAEIRSQPGSFLTIVICDVDMTDMMN